MVALFGFFAGLSLSSVQYIGHLGMSAIYSVVLQTSSVSLESHMQRYSVSVSVLPVGNAGWHVPVLHILCCELALRRALDDRRSFFGRTSRDLLVLMSRWFKWVLHNIGHLNDALDARVGI